MIGTNIFFAYLLIVELVRDYPFSCSCNCINLIDMYFPFNYMRLLSKIFRFDLPIFNQNIEALSLQAKNYLKSSNLLCISCKLWEYSGNSAARDVQILTWNFYVCLFSLISQKLWNPVFPSLSYTSFLKSEHGNFVKPQGLDSGNFTVSTLLNFGYVITN